MKKNRISIFYIHNTCLLPLLKIKECISNDFLRIFIHLYKTKTKNLNNSC